MSNEKCLCSLQNKLIFTCSGASDTGELSDRAGRKLSREGVGRMYCAAGIGGRIEGIMNNTRAAKQILLIDGCPVKCLKNVFKNAGLENTDYLNLADIGFTKGSSPATEENIEKVSLKAKSLLSGK